MRRSAFTLIELLVVIAIVGLLSSIAVVSLVTARDKAKIAAGMAFASHLDRTAGEPAGIWLFNEGSGGVASDASGSGHTGSLLNGPTWSTDTPSGSGYSIYLDGSNDYVQAYDYSGFKYRGGNMSLGIWIKPDVAENNGAVLISKPWNGNGGYNYTLSYGADRKIYVGLGGVSGYNTPATNATVPSGKWTFVAATVDSAKTVSIYIDGSLKLTATHNISSWATTDNSIPLAIGTLYPYGGAWGGNAGFSFGGFIDEPRIFNDALSAAQIHRLYVEGIKKHPTVLATNKF